MIEIKCVADKTAELCAFCGVQADAAWEMTERGERLGYSLVRFEEGTPVLVWLEAADLPLTDALFRATLNALPKECNRVHLRAENARCLAVRKGYLPSVGPFELEIREFFSKTACKG